MKKRLRISHIDDDILRSLDDMRSMAKQPSEYTFKKFVDCDFVYIINDWAKFKNRGSIVVMVKNNKILDIIGPISKFTVESDRVNGETIGFSYVSKNKMKIRHPFFRLAVSVHNDLLHITPRNIFKEEFLYNE